MWVFGLVFGLALLTKFSTFLLIPAFGFAAFVWGLVQNQKRWFWAAKYAGGFILVLIIAYAVVGAVYTFHVWNYPPEKQAIDTRFILGTFGSEFLVNLTAQMAFIPGARSLGQYMLGLLMVIQRSAGGNTTYYLGNVSAAGSRTATRPATART